jgi:hypothetical protein
VLKCCKPPGYCTVGTRSVHETAVGNRSSAGGTVTAIIRTKVLQISTLQAVRSVRAIHCGVLRQGSSSNPLARSSPDH